YTNQDMWTFADYDSWRSTDISGFKVQAVDGEIGSVDEATYEIGASYIVVDTGPWIFGKKVLLPAGVVDRVDFENRHLLVNRTKDEIQNAPEFDPERYHEEAYRNNIGTYYGERMPTGTRR
ncbi:MAG TPA: PRC-barrel domain-containing protein, partial [Candidatus Limnocylindria bacterium]